MGLAEGLLPFQAPRSPSTDEEIGRDVVPTLEHWEDPQKGQEHCLNLADIM